jgi:hypothetical protein
MPGTTARGYPYPVDTDPIDVAGDILALAEAIDGDMQSAASDILGVGDLIETEIMALDAKIDRLMIHGRVHDIRMLDGNSATRIDFPVPYVEAPIVVVSGSYANFPTAITTIQGVDAAGFWACCLNATGAGYPNLMFQFAWISVGRRT